MIIDEWADLSNLKVGDNVEVKAPDPFNIDESEILAVFKKPDLKFSRLENLINIATRSPIDIKATNVRVHTALKKIENFVVTDDL